MVRGGGGRCEGAARAPDGASQRRRGLRRLPRDAVVADRIHPVAAGGFGSIGELYDRARPDYPAAAIDWLAGRLGLAPGRTVVDLGAGTGKLTRQLVPTGVRVVAVEPLEGMRAELERAVPEVEVLDATAEAIPLEAGSVDAVVAASAFHWFRIEEAAPEIHRILRPAGALALVWNHRDPTHPLHQELNELLEPLRADAPGQKDWQRPLEASGLFGERQERTFPHSQVLDVDGLVDRVTSVSFVSLLPDPERRKVQDAVRELANGLAEPFAFPYRSQVMVYSRA